MQSFYTSFVSSSLTFGLTAWGGNVSQNDRNRIDKTILRAGRLIGRKQDNLETIHDTRTLRKLERIFNDETHTHPAL